MLRERVEEQRVRKRQNFIVPRQLMSSLMAKFIDIARALLVFVREGKESLIFSELNKGKLIK